jgi:hypothetical protein
MIEAPTTLCAHCQQRFTKSRHSEAAEEIHPDPEDLSDE